MSLISVRILYLFLNLKNHGILIRPKMIWIFVTHNNSSSLHKQINTPCESPLHTIWHLLFLLSFVLFCLMHSIKRGNCWHILAMHPMAGKQHEQQAFVLAQSIYSAVGTVKFDLINTHNIQVAAPYPEYQPCLIFTGKNHNAHSTTHFLGSCRLVPLPCLLMAKLVQIWKTTYPRSYH